MNTPKKLLLIITAMLAGVAFIASCSKESAAKAGKKGGKSSATTSAKAKAILPTGKGSLSAFRNGQYVTLGWQADLPGVTIKKIEVSRSSTGKINTRKGVATLKPDAVSYQDRLPDENAYWYWVKLVAEDGKFQELGPARVDIDRAGSASYIKPEDTYKISITRTDDFATLKWDFPEDEYANIKIIRAPQPVSGPFNRMRIAEKKAKDMKGKGGKGGKGWVTSVVTSMERKSQYVDALEKPNSEYWYWFRITLKSGVIVDRGPIKAEFGNQ